MTTRKTVVAALPLLLMGCFFEFDRGIELLPGDVGGRAVRAADEPAPYAAVAVGGTGRRGRTGGDGALIVRDLPAGGWQVSVRDDENGDGWDERFAQRAFAINVVTHADGLFGQSEAKRTWVLLGDVLLDGVVEARGRVEREDGTPVPGAIVVAYRSVELPASSLDGAVEREAITVDGEVEATTASDEDGAFFFPALGAGAVTYAAFFDDDTDDLASEPVTIDASEGDAVTADVLTLSVVEPAATRAVQLELDRVPAGPLDVTLVRAGVPREVATGGDIFELPGRPAALSVPLEVPHGVWDVYLEDTGSDAFSVAYQQAATVAGDDLSTWGLLLLSDRDRCAGEDAEGLSIRDCDGDGVAGLPLFDDPSDPEFDVWLDCVSACESAHGSSSGDATCSVGGSEWDCDDDGDGQADVTEPDCYGLALGANRDGDQYCDPVDPFPQCAENDPAAPACGADRDPADWQPPDAPFDDVAPDAGPDPDGGVPVDGGGADGGPADGGADVDGGPGDGGGPEDAGAEVDAGADGGPAAASFVRSFGAGRFGRWDSIEGGASWGALALYGLSFPFPIAGCSLNAPTGDSVYVASFDDSLQCQTAVSIPLLGDDVGDLIALPDGGFVLVGFATDPVTFPGGPNGQDESLNPGTAFSMGFVARYAADGSLVHLRRLVPTTANETTGIYDVVRAPGGYYVAGSFLGAGASLEGEPPVDDAGPSNDGALDLVNGNTGSNTGFFAFLDDTDTPSAALSSVLTSSSSAQVFGIAYAPGSPDRLYVSGGFNDDVDGVAAAAAGGGQFLVSYDVTTSVTRTAVHHALGGSSIFVGLAAGDGVAYWGVTNFSAGRDLYDESGTLHVSTAGGVSPLYRIPDDGSAPTLFASLAGVVGEQTTIDGVAVQDGAVFFAGSADATTSDVVTLDYGTTPVTFSGGSQFQANPAGFVARADDNAGVASPQWHLLAVGEFGARPLGVHVRSDESVAVHLWATGETTLGSRPVVDYPSRTGILWGIDAEGTSGE